MAVGSYTTSSIVSPGPARSSPALLGPRGFWAVRGRHQSRDRPTLRMCRFPLALGKCSFKRTYLTDTTDKTR